MTVFPGHNAVLLSSVLAVQWVLVHASHCFCLESMWLSSLLHEVQFLL